MTTEIWDGTLGEFKAWNFALRAAYQDLKAVGDKDAMAFVAAWFEDVF